MKKEKPLAERLEKLNACRAAIDWCGERTLAEAWEECERGDWMLWLAGCANIDRKLLVRAAVKCAELALPIYEKRYPKDTRVRNCIKVTLKWTFGKATIEEVRAAAAAAYTYAYADDAVAAVAYAAYAADAADAAAYAYAAYAAYDADDADAADAKTKMRKECAKKVRRIIPLKAIEEALTN